MSDLIRMTAVDVVDGLTDPDHPLTRAFVGP